MTQLQKLGKANTTVINHSNGATSVILYKTEVVMFKPDGYITLDSGGWKTDTTRNRMNQASNQFNLGYRVYQKEGAWYVLVANISEPLPFVDGIRFYVQRVDGRKQNEI